MYNINFVYRAILIISENVTSGSTVSHFRMLRVDDNHSVPLVTVIFSWNIPDSELSHLLPALLFNHKLQELCRYQNGPALPYILCLISQNYNRTKPIRSY